jgi:hypothetical protein
MYKVVGGGGILQDSPEEKQGSLTVKSGTQKHAYMRVLWVWALRMGSYYQEGRAGGGRGQ